MNILSALFYFLQEVKENLNQILFNDELGMQLKNFNLDHCFDMITKIIKLILNVQEQIDLVSIADIIPKSETDTFLIMQSLEGEIIKLKKVLFSNLIISKSFISTSCF